MHPGRVHALSNAHHIIFGFVLPLTYNGAGGVFNEHCGFGIVCVHVLLRTTRSINTVCIH
jgi:hypothetical protein